MRRFQIGAVVCGMCWFGCEGPMGTHGDIGSSCTVTDNGDGTSTILCDDGTTTTISNGAPGKTGKSGDAGSSCSVEDNGDGTATITCEDGAEYTVENGEPGDSCTVDDNMNGTFTIACENGTEAVVSNGTPGDSCTIDDNGDGSATITCEDGTEYTVSDGSSCGVLDNGDGTYSITCDDGTEVDVSDGQPGASCSIVENDDGTATISCDDGTAVVISGGESGPIDTTIDPYEDLPGLTLEITSVTGATGADSTFQAGDTLSVTFTATLGDGTTVPLNELDSGTIWFHGPTFNYQHVLPSGREEFYYSDVKTLAVENADGSYTYTFASPIPATYGSPLYDTTKFSDGEMTGAALDPGTYTVAMRSYKNYTVEGVTVRDVGWDTQDVLLGGATVIESREVVTTENCNQCHSNLQFHSGTYRSTNLCVTCHTSGAEDRNSTDTDDATNVTIDFRVMIHKLHNGEHLPSVLGVATNSDGTRTYAATPTPYIVGKSSVDEDTGGINFSEVAFPVWPNLNVAMPRDTGYSSLSSTQKTTDDTIRYGATACDKCHGDPDGDGTLAAPAQGDLAYDLTVADTNASRRACQACHDDINWAYSYKSNTTDGMSAQADDSACAYCHPVTGAGVGGSVEDSHVHPLYRSALNPGLNLEITALVEAGTNDADGTIDPGEKIQVTFTMTNDVGDSVAGSSLSSSPTVVISGPNYNRNIVNYYSLPTGAFSGSPPYTMLVPKPVLLEFAGDSTSTTGDVFATASSPHWNVTNDTTTVYVRTATDTSTTLAAAASPLQNFIDVASATGFVRDDYIVIDDGVAGEEYLKIQWVEGTRLWFANVNTTSTYQPYLRNAHAAGDTVSKVTLTTKTVTTDYTLNATTGTITEVTEFGTENAVIVSYTTDFVMPATYPGAINGSPDVDETSGKWAGLSIVDGTYAIGIWSYINRYVTPAGASTDNGNGDNTTYRGTSVGHAYDFLVGSATEIESYEKISSSENCYSCHNDMFFHGGSRRGVETCLMCHATAGAEDRPPYVAASAPATTGVLITFRQMLHKIHMGDELKNADTYTVNGDGSSSYPSNYTSYTYGEIAFPAWPEGVKNCDKCHGDATVWLEPDDRTHPDQTTDTRVYTVACGSCHDSDTAAAHFDIMTSSGGVESCEVCHGAGSDFEVELMHKVR